MSELNLFRLQPIDTQPNHNCKGTSRESTNYAPNGRHICSPHSRSRQPSHVCDRPLQAATGRSCRSILAAPENLRLVAYLEHAEYSGYLGNMVHAMRGCIFGETLASRCGVCVHLYADMVPRCQDGVLLENIRNCTL